MFFAAEKCNLYPGISREPNYLTNNTSNQRGAPKFYTIFEFCVKIIKNMSKNFDIGYVSKYVRKIMNDDLIEYN